MEEYIRRFRDLLLRATEDITSEYFHLPIDGQDAPIYRERVYCYELYHCLRSHWPDDFPFSLGGEVDKTGHPLYRGGPIDRLKPDLLVHTPGDRNGNLIVLEVKPINASLEGITKDLLSLTAFEHRANYHKGIYLIYGGDQEQLDAFRKAVVISAQGPRRNDINLNFINLFWHRAPRQRAQFIEHPAQ